MSSIFWLDIIAYGTSVIVAAAIVLVVLGGGIQRASNRYFALFGLAEAVWALTSLLLRLTLWLEVGRPLLMLEVATVAFALMGPFLLLFAVYYTHRSMRWGGLAAVLSLAATAALAVPVFRHQLMSNPYLGLNDIPLYTISTWGFGVAVIPALCMFWALVLFWQERKESANVTLAGSILILLAGFVVGGLFNLAWPIMSLTTTLSLGILGYGIIRQQFLNPLRDLTVELEKKVQERTRELEQRVLAEQEQRDRLAQANQEIEQRIAVEQERLLYLQRLGLQVRETVATLGDTAVGIETMTAHQAAGTTEQTTAVTQASTTIDEVRAIADETSKRANGVAEMVRRTSDVAQDGQLKVEASIAGMQQVKVKVDTIARTILDLSEQAQAIGAIISSVGEIAAQSNMLALNAAVEAARAGEAGRGFAVVAGEVRTLAERSRAATAEVREILTSIQKGVNTAVMATEEGIKGADAGMVLAGQAGESIRRLAESARSSSEFSLQIAAAAVQQLAGMEQIATAMASIHQVTEQNLADIRQAQQAVYDLNALAGQLREAVGQYQ